MVKALERGSTLLTQRLVTKYNSILTQRRYWLNDLSRSITPFCSYDKKGGHNLLTRLLDGGHTSFPLFYSISLLSLPSCLVKINLNPIPCFLGLEYSKTIPNLS